MSKWAYIALMFFGVNMLNNWAFAFNISVPVHIILRSFGSVTTMLAGALQGKRYTWLQVTSVIILTVGVLVSAFADAGSKVSCSVARHINRRHDADKRTNRANLSKPPAATSAPVFSFSWPLRSSRPTWASTSKTHTPNTAPTGAKTSSTATSCRSLCSFLWLALSVVNTLTSRQRPSSTSHLAFPSSKASRCLLVSHICFSTP